MTNSFTPNPKLDLVLERVLDVPPALVWEAWTDPEHLMPWFCPKPWRTTECEIDLRPGGKFRTVMEGPNGERHDNTGCYLEVVRGERLVWTSALLPGFRPAAKALSAHDLLFTAVIEIAPRGAGTRYVATAIHGEEDTRKRHEEMGFHQGWGAALDQLVEYAKKM